MMLDLMDRTFHDFENPMPDKPVLVNMPFGTVFRFKRKEHLSGILEKLERAQSGVRAATFNEERFRAGAGYTTSGD